MDDENIVQHDQHHRVIVKRWVVDIMEQMQQLGIQLNVQHEVIVKHEQVFVHCVRNQRQLKYEHL